MSQPQSAATFIPVAEFPGEKFREEFRAANGVKLVDPANDGQGLHRLPNGMYGFTYSPGLEDTPVFIKRGMRTFEVHKSASGETIYIGFLTDSDRDKTTAGGPGEIKLFPSLEGDFKNPVALPVSRVLKFRPATTRDDGSLSILLKP